MSNNANMPPRTIFVRDEDMELWERATQFASAHRWSMSALIMTALEAYIEQGAKPTGGGST